MTFLLADAKARKGILPADTTKDLILQVSLDTALALAETWCNRRFMYKAVELETFSYPFAQGLQLSRYPLESVASVTPVGQTAIGTDMYQAVLKTGQIKSLGWLSAKQIDVTYAGGYKVLPADLELALWMVFDAAWAAMPGGGGGGASSVDVIKRITLPDVGSIEMATNSASSSGGGAAGGAGGLLPLSAASILNLYRLEVC
jgi:hypothetical protein